MTTACWDVLNQLQCVTIVCIGSRPGSDFLQSLFDSHPQVLTVDGTMYFHEFYEEATSIGGTAAPFARHHRLTEISLKDFFYEFAYKNLALFNTLYDNVDRKDRLGDQRNQHNEVDIDQFVAHATQLMDGIKPTRRNLMMAVYGGFALTRNEDLSRKRVLLHHVHHVRRLTMLREDFPDVKVIGAMRDPRAGYSSQILGWQRYSEDFLTPRLYAFVVRRILVEGEGLKTYPPEQIRANLLERLHAHPEQVLKNACRWLGIEFDPVLLRSTWSGKEWWGDALSVGIDTVFNPQMYEQSRKKWRERMSVTDQVIFSSLMRRKIFQYDYDRQYTGVFWMVLVPFLVLIPNRFERASLKKYLATREMHSILWWTFALFERYQSMYKKYLKTIFGREAVLDVL